MFRTPHVAATLALVLVAACVEDPAARQPAPAPGVTSGPATPVLDAPVEVQALPDLERTLEATDHAAWTVPVVSPDEDPLPTMQLSFTLTDFAGRPLHNADLCSVDGCTTVYGGTGTLELLAAAEVEMWVESTDHVRQVYQFVTPAWDAYLPGLIAPTHDEAELLASLFGITLDPTKATVAQFVVHPQGVVPSIDAPAEGPFFIDLFGVPVHDPAGRTEPGGGFYLFFNVEPGDWQVSLPGCTEGDAWWGAPGDQRIDVSVQADDALGLFTVQCL